MFSIHKDDTLSALHDFFTDIHCKAFANVTELKELSDSDNESCGSDCHSSAVDREELLFVENIELKNQTDSLQLLLAAQKNRK